MLRGSGQFGEIKLATIKTLNLIVAAKVFKVNLPRKKILAEDVAIMTLSGHVNFPYCFGLFNENVIRERCNHVRTLESRCKI